VKGGAKSEMRKLTFWFVRRIDDIEISNKLNIN